MAGTILQGDALERLRTLPDESVNCCVTSPPYWGLRDYGTGTWDGGDEGCDHEPPQEWIDHNFNAKSGFGSGAKTQSAAAKVRWYKPDGSCPACGARRIDKQLGLEPTPEAFVESLVEVFREVRRVLRADGTLWLNLGDCYATRAGAVGHRPGGGKQGARWRGDGSKHDYGIGPVTQPNRMPLPGLKPKDLVGIPWRVAFALQADGWWLRQDIIWCLSGGTWLYVRTATSGVTLTTIKDLARLDPYGVELWNGERWTRLLGMSKSARRGDEVEIVLRSGERISCTPTHCFPMQRGILAAADLKVGDTLTSCRLPEPDTPRDCAIDEDAAWFAGLYVAEGSRSGDTIQISGHARETVRWEKLQRVARKYGGTATRTVSGNCMDVRLYGRVLNAIIDELVAGRTARDKAFSPSVWRYSNSFVAAMVDGYLAGDGHWDTRNGRWRLGFTRNYGLERDLRTACARLGYTLRLALSSVMYKGTRRPTFRGELRTERSGHHNERDMGEIIAIRRARCREVYDLGVADESHLFALASGVLTHNSKPNPMPESVRDRCTKSHEYLFLLSKSERYYYDADAIAEPFMTDPKENYPARARITGRATQAAAVARGGDRDKSGGFPPSGSGRNARSVWTIATQPFKGAHFAVFPKELARRCILAGCPESMRTVYCATCGFVIDLDHAITMRIVRQTGGATTLPTGEVPVLQQGMSLCSDQKTERELSAMREADPIQKGNVVEPLLQQDMRKSLDLGQQSEYQGRLHDDQGLQPHIFPHEPNGDSCGLCDGTSASNGGNDGEAAISVGSSASPEWNQERQPTGELGTGTETIPRSPAQATQAGDPMSSLREVDQNIGTCPHCGGHLRRGSRSGIVLDPFFGSGTVGVVAQQEGREYIGIELNPVYVEMARERIKPECPMERLL